MSPLRQLNNSNSYLSQILSLIRTSQCQKLNLCIPILITVAYNPALAQFLLAYQILLYQAFRIHPSTSTRYLSSTTTAWWTQLVTTPLNLPIRQLDCCSHQALLSIMGRTVRKSQNSGSPAPPVSMANARCGVTANNVAQFLWYSVIEIALLTVSSPPRPPTKEKPVSNLDPTTSSTLVILFRLFSLCAIIAESFFLYHISCQSFASDSNWTPLPSFNHRNLQHMRLRLTSTNSTSNKNKQAFPTVLAAFL